MDNIHYFLTQELIDEESVETGFYSCRSDTFWLW